MTAVSTESSDRYTLGFSGKVEENIFSLCCAALGLCLPPLMSPGHNEERGMSL